MKCRYCSREKPCGCADANYKSLSAADFSLGILAISVLACGIVYYAFFPELGPTEDVRMPVVYYPECADARYRGETCRYVFEVVR